MYTHPQFERAGDAFSRPTRSRNAVPSQMTRVNSIAPYANAQNSCRLGPMDFMTTYKRLALPVRHKGLSVMEVLEGLRTGADFCDDDQAEFHIGRLQLLSGDRVGLPDIRFRSANENA